MKTEKLEKRYEVGGKTFIQRPMVLGQAQQLLALLKGLPLPGSFQLMAVMVAVGDKLHDLLAIVLVEKDKKPAEKKPEETAAFLAENLPADMAMDMVADFLSLNGTFFDRLKSPETPKKKDPEEPEKTTEPETP